MDCELNTLNSLTCGFKDQIADDETLQGCFIEWLFPCFHLSGE